MQALVNRARTSMSPAAGQLPPAFDTAAAQALYDDTLRGTAALLNGTTALVVAPSGPLLSIPFSMLLTGPAGDNLSQAPWLIQQMTVAHVPAPANFVSLRKLAGGKHAPEPWIGFGNPLQVTQAQAVASFPAGTCAESARLLAALPRLPGAGTELDQVSRLLGGAAQDEILADRFTTAAVVGASLQSYQVVEFATHGLLPSELACQPEPALLTSPAPGATDAASALLTSSRIATLTLNADVVILSACDSGGPENAGGAAAETSGESLSGLARSFFFAGARSILATHWNVNDRVTTILVAQTMKLYHDDPSRGLATALALEQRDLLAQATNGALSALAHPFYWAPLALIGDGGGAKPVTTASRQAGAQL
jgi:CHAT domain-containing protein